MTGVDYLRFIAALVFVLGLICATAWLVRRFRLDGSLGGRSGGAKGRRLALVETLPLDARRRLVLVRRDDVEHLLLVGQDGNRLIESAAARPTSPASSSIRREQPS
jgi:flagellar protein FliO/FliZ